MKNDNKNIENSDFDISTPRKEDINQNKFTNKNSSKISNNNLIKNNINSNNKINESRNYDDSSNISNNNKSSLDLSSLNLEKNTIKNNKKSYAINHLKKSADYIDLNQIKDEKQIDEVKSPLEFFILSLSKSLDLKPKQAAALLSNNRKFLIQISNRGIKGDYSKINIWYDDLFANYKKLLQILSKAQMKDAKLVTFATISVGLYSKNPEVCQNAFSLLTQLEADVGIDNDWFFKDGLDVLYFCISKHTHMRVAILGLLEKISKINPEKIIFELFNVRKLGTQKIYEFISNVLDEIDNCGIDFQNYLKYKIPDFCFNEKYDLPLACAILIDFWIKLDLSNTSFNKKNFNRNIDADRNLTNNILKFMKNAMRDKSHRNLQITAISQMFRLMKNLQKDKDETSSTIYKNLVFLFLENYDDTKLREIFLLNFSFIFSLDKTIPIDILLEPYIRQLKGNNNSTNINVINTPTNYDLNDFKFLIKILDHPNIKIFNLKEILEFSTLVSYTNLFYARSANLIINIILDKHLNSYNDLLNSKNLNQDIINIYDICVSYIKNALKIFLQNTKDLMILETPHDITNLKINYIIKNIEADVIEANEAFRKEKGFFSSGLLSLLWNYNKHDDVLLMLEEKYTEKYRISESLSKESSKQNRDNRKQNFIQSGKPNEFLKILKEKREKNQKEKEEKKIQNALKEAQFLPDSYKKALFDGTSVNKLKQGNSLLESLSLKELLKSQSKDSLINENVLKKKLSDLSSPNNKSLKILSSAKKGNFSATIIQPEGIHKPTFVPNRNPLVGNILPIFYDYENEGEEREKLACEGLLKQFSKHLKQYFNFYITEINNTIIKHNLMKMLRDIGVEAEELNLEELNSIMRTTFGSSLNYINKDQFEKLLIQIAYIIYSKTNLSMTVSMCLKEILKKISLWCKNNKIKGINNINSESTSTSSNNNKNSSSLSSNGANNRKIFKYLKSQVEDNIIIKEKNYQEVYDEDISLNNNNNSLLSQINTNLYRESSSFRTDNDNNFLDKNNYANSNTTNTNSKKNSNKREILIPPGYRKITQTQVNYEYSLPRDFAFEFLSEAKVICYEILNEIIAKKFSSAIMEPYVKINKEIKVVEESLEPKKRWGTNLTMAYTKLEKKYENIGKECADVLEDLLRAVSMGRESLDKPKFLTNKEKALKEEQLLKENENLERDKLLKERKKEIAKKLEEYKNSKSLQDKEKLQEKLLKEQKLQALNRSIELKRQQTKQNFEKAKMEKDKKKEEKEKAEKTKKDKKLAEVLKKKKEFFNKQRRKLKEQFKEIKNQKDNYLKQQQKLINVKLPDVNIQKIIDKDKEFVEFEKNLNDKVEELLQRNDLKGFLADYEFHFKQIYDFYSKIGNTKITLHHEDAIHLKEFKEFCVNFMLSGLLLTTDQINYIFKKISKRNSENTDDKFFLKYNDFMVSMIYIALFMKTWRRGSHRIMPNDLEKIEISTLKNLIEFMNLRLPYNKRQLEDFINDRRALSAKELLKMQSQSKKENYDSLDLSLNRKNDSTSNIKKNSILELIKKEKENKQNGVQFDKLRKKEKQEITKNKDNEKSRINEGNKQIINQSPKK